MTKKKQPRKGVSLQVYIPERLREALDKAAEVHRRKYTQEVEIALEEFLSKEGFWPPRSGQQE